MRYDDMRLYHISPVFPRIANDNNDLACPEGAFGERGWRGNFSKPVISASTFPSVEVEVEDSQVLETDLPSHLFADDDDDGSAVAAVAGQVHPPSFLPPHSCDSSSSSSSHGMRRSRHGLLGHDGNAHVYPFVGDLGDDRPNRVGFTSGI